MWKALVRADLQFLIRFLGLTGFALLLAACQSVEALNNLTPRGDFSLRQDVPYGEHPRQVMDIYTPRRIRANIPVVVFVHGGSWSSGDKDQYLFLGQAFTELGYVTVLPNYRLYPDAEFPDFVEDIALALAVLGEMPPVARCANHREIILIGHSAGAHTAAMLATEPRYLRQSGANVQLKAFIGLSGPYDLPLDDPRVVDKFASVGDGRDAKPFRLATAVTPPTLLLHGEADDLVGPEQSERLAERLRELGVPVTLRLYEDTDHIDIVLGLAKLLRHKNPAYRHTARFLHSQGLTRPCTDNR